MSFANDYCSASRTKQHKTNTKYNNLSEVVWGVGTLLDKLKRYLAQERDTQWFKSNSKVQ